MHNRRVGPLETQTKLDMSETNMASDVEGHQEMRLASLGDDDSNDEEGEMAITVA